jgi:predicted translation initiation factor SUI1
MEKRGTRNVLFLCTGNYYRSRFAEILFNHMAGGMGLAWKATSRALALERGAGNVGPMAPAAVENLQTQGVGAAADFTRLPVQATADDFARAHWIVALKKTEHVPLLQERFPTWAEKVECWEVDDDAKALATIEAEVLNLTARLIRGGKPREAIAPPPVPEISQRASPKKDAAVVRVGRTTKGRRGKGVTIVSDVPLDEAGLQELAARLKQRCGTGGTVKDGRIEIQGDQRDRLVAELEGLGFRVKRAGG